VDLFLGKNEEGIENPIYIYIWVWGAKPNTGGLFKKIPNW